MRTTRTKQRLTAIQAALAWAWDAAAQTLIVEEGRPNAEIVIAKGPPRLVRLAADALRDYVPKHASPRHAHDPGQQGHAESRPGVLCAVRRPA